MRHSLFQYSLMIFANSSCGMRIEPLLRPALSRVLVAVCACVSEGGMRGDEEGIYCAGKSGFCTLGSVAKVISLASRSKTSQGCRHDWSRSWFLAGERSDWWRWCHVSFVYAAAPPACRHLMLPLTRCEPFVGSRDAVPESPTLAPAESAGAGATENE